jgi:hypothetical protein
MGGTDRECKLRKVNNGGERNEASYLQRREKGPYIATPS